MKKPLLIYGAGGLGREILSMLRSMGTWDPVGFIDDAAVPNSTVNGVRVLGGKDALCHIDGPGNMVLAIGNPVQKREIVEALKSYALTYPVIAHPAAIIQAPEAVMVGEGTVLCAGTIVTTDVRIGNHVLLNLNSTIGHDTQVGAYTSIMCGVNIAGEVSIGHSVMIGSGANVLNRVAIGNNSRVGMGAVVIKDVDPDITVAGVPAKRITP